MERIATIRNAIATAATFPGTYNELPITAQTKVVFSCYSRVENGIKWWNEQLNDENATPEFRKLAVQNINERSRCMPGYLDMLDRARHYTSAASRETKFDVSNMDDEGNGAEEYMFENVTVKDNPCAWAYQLLVKDQRWPEDYKKADHTLPVYLYDVEKTYSKYLARYMALSILAAMDVYAPPQREDDDTPSDIVLIAACSSQIKALAAQSTDKATARALQQMFKKQFGKTPLSISVWDNGERTVKLFDSNELCALVNTALELDEDDRTAAAERKADEETKRETKAFTQEIKAATRQAIFTSTVMAEMAKSAVTMAKAGVSNDVIGSIQQQLMQRLMPGTPAPTTPAPQPVAETPAPEVHNPLAIAPTQVTTPAPQAEAPAPKVKALTKKEREAAAKRSAELAKKTASIGTVGEALIEAGITQ